MISTEIKILSSCKKELTITMDKEELDPLREKQLKKVQKDVQVPGFRKGKAPLNLVKRNYGDAVEAYTLDAAIEHGLRKSAEENELYIVGQPEAKKVDFNEEGSLISIIEVETFPEVELKKYKGLELTRDVYEVTDKLVDETIDRLRKEKAEVTVVDGKVEDGHVVHMDMQELDENGKPLEGKKYDNITVRVGEGKFDPELEKQLIGLANDADQEIEKVYPDDFPQKEFAGKKERYAIKIKNVEQETLPELDDEFAQEVGENFKTVDDLRKATLENLEHQYQQESENRLSADLSQGLVEENPFDVPDAIVQDYLDRVVADAKRQDPKLKEDMIRQHYQAESLFTLKWMYLREEIAKAEKIEVDEADEKKFLDELKEDKLRELYQSNAQLMERVKEDIRNKKVFDFLIENSKVKDNKIKLD